MLIPLPTLILADLLSNRIDHDKAFNSEYTVIIYSFRFVWLDWAFWKEYVQQ